MNLKKWLAVLGAVGAFGLVGGSPARASSHSDAPLSKLDPQTNLTDLYAFVRNTPNGKVLVVEVSVHPFCEPGDGVMYDAFSDDALYSISIANPTNGAELQRYDFKFSPVSSAAGNYKNLDTALRYGRGADVGGNPDAGPINNVGDNHQNFVQTYTVSRTVGGTTTNLSSGLNLIVPPCNTGVRTTPFYNDRTGDATSNPNFGRAVSGAASRGTLDRYTQQTTYDLSGGQTVFAGSREDGFYCDIPGIFDFLDPRLLLPTGPTPAGATAAFGQGDRVNGYNGVDGFKGYNVLHYAITIPISQLPAPIAYQAPFSGSAPGIGPRLGVGVYASVSRPRVTLRRTNGDNVSSGPYIQVNRLGNPFFNELLVAIRDKDNYNRTLPTGDAAYAKYATNPEAGVLINALYGGALPHPVVTSGRADLALVFIVDVLRVDTTTGAAPVAGEAGFSRLSVLGGDVLTSTAGGGTTVPGGWPNGRRFGDDVADITLTTLASGPDFKQLVVVGDNISHNDQFYNLTFPYAGTPNAGTRNSKDSGINKSLTDLPVP